MVTERSLAWMYDERVDWQTAVEPLAPPQRAAAALYPTGGLGVGKIHNCGWAVALTSYY